MLWDDAQQELLLLLPLVLELERRLDAVPLVEEAPAQVDLAHVAHVEADEVEAEEEDGVGQHLHGEGRGVVDTL